MSMFDVTTNTVTAVINQWYAVGKTGASTPFIATGVATNPGAANATVTLTVAGFPILPAGTEIALVNNGPWGLTPAGPSWLGFQRLSVASTATTVVFALPFAQNYAGTGAGSLFVFPNPINVAGSYAVRCHNPNASNINFRTIPTGSANTFASATEVPIQMFNLAAGRDVYLPLRNLNGQSDLVLFQNSAAGATTVSVQECAEILH